MIEERQLAAASVYPDPEGGGQRATCQHCQAAAQPDSPPPQRGFDRRVICQDADQD